MEYPIVLQQDALPEINPYTGDTSYDQCVVLRIVASETWNMLTCKKETFEYHISIHMPHHVLRIADYIAYHTQFDRHIIVLDPENHWGQIARQLQHMKDAILSPQRPDDPEYLVHSATLQAFHSIQEDQCIYSWNKLNSEGRVDESQPIGGVLGDPEDFRDYVMLGVGVACEIVVLSRQLGCISMDQDKVYEPGARIYYRTNDLIEHGLLVRDGCHYKVRDQLSLRLSACIITPAYHESDTTWTPRSFSIWADEQLHMIMRTNS